MKTGEYSENEWVEKELPKIKIFFRKLSRFLNEFANLHNLRIEKYYHYIPGWEFLFRHPLGGRCYIEILRGDEEHVTLMADWSTYDYDTGIGRHKHTERAVYGVDKTELKAVLDKLLKNVLSWTEEDLGMISQRSADYKESISKEDFEKDLLQYPTPKL